jgi:carboxylate-amine ligase
VTATISPYAPGPRLRDIGVSLGTLDAVTFGVEEEFLLLDPVSGRPVPAAPVLLRMLAGEPGPQAEFLRFQFETATRVCTRLDELRGELVRLRRMAAGATDRAGCLLVASGIAPYGTPGIGSLTRKARYRQLACLFPTLVPDCVTCGCHVHVGVPSRELGVQVLVRLRPWLAPLLALSANSPIAKGRDTGWASWRYRVGSRWPTNRPPKVWRDASDYDATVGRLIHDHAAIDEASVYFLARLSPRYPTVEVRVADTCLDVDVAVLLAALVRGLVVTAMDEVSRGIQPRLPAAEAVGASLTAAARYGLRGTGVDPCTGQRVTQRVLLRRLVEHIRDALDALGDTQYADELVRRLDEQGTGAQRQRARWTAEAPAGTFVEALAGATLATGDR